MLLMKLKPSLQQRYDIYCWILAKLIGLKYSCPISVMLKAATIDTDVSFDIADYEEIWNQPKRYDFAYLNESRIVTIEKAIELCERKIG